MKNCGPPGAFFLVMARNQHGEQPVGAGRTPLEAMADALARPGGVRGPIAATDESTYNRAKAHLRMWDTSCRMSKELIGEDITTPRYHDG